MKVQRSHWRPSPGEAGGDWGNRLGTRSGTSHRGASEQSRVRIPFWAVANVLSDSDGRRYWGSEVPHVRWRNRKLRARWQAQPTRSAQGRLKMLAGQESRFARPVNHGISQQIVRTAKGTGGGIRREELNGIRTRAKVRHAQPGVLHGWAFWQLRPMIAYKAARAGVLVEFIDPRHTSRTCSQCGHSQLAIICEKGNRRNQPDFRCRRCGHEAHADINATEYIRPGRCKEAERNVVQNRRSHSVRFRRLSAAVTSPRL